MVVVDPPYRIDPFQNIVNVSWGTGTTEGAWFSCIASGNALECDISHVETDTSGTNGFATGRSCTIHDSAEGVAAYGSRPGYNYCDWPIQDPTEVGVYVDIGYPSIAYSAGTLYKKISETKLAWENSRWYSRQACTWLHTFVPGSEPIPPGPLRLTGGPDVSPAEGALCPELNGAGADQKAYADYLGLRFIRPIYVPHWRVFVVDDDDFATGMDGIHEAQDRPDIEQYPPSLYS